MRVFERGFEVRTEARRPTTISREVEEVVRAAGVRAGLCTIFVQHTSASLLVQENADPAVMRDLVSWLADLAPESRPWEHDDEGPDDMPGHAKAAVLRTAETVPISGGRLVLGTWQGIYVLEHRAKSHARKIHVTIVGE